MPLSVMIWMCYEEEITHTESKSVLACTTGHPLKLKQCRSVLGSHTERSICSVSAQHKQPQNPSKPPASLSSHIHFLAAQVIQNEKHWKMMEDPFRCRGVRMYSRYTVCSFRWQNIKSSSIYFKALRLLLCRPFKTHCVNIRVPWCLNY